MKVLIAPIVILTAALTLAGCGTVGPGSETKSEGASGAQAASGAVAIRRYPVHGKILTVDAAAKIARMDGGAIGDWMGPMTMNYTIKDDAGLAQLKPGSEVDATVVVNGDDFWLENVKVVK